MALIQIGSQDARRDATGMKEEPIPPADAAAAVRLFHFIIYQSRDEAAVCAVCGSISKLQQLRWQPENTEECGAYESSCRYGSYGDMRVHM